MFSFIAGESPNDEAKGAIMTMSYSYVFGLYDAIGPLKSTLSKEREKYVWDYAKLYTVLVLLVIDLYSPEFASNSGSLIK